MIWTLSIGSLNKIDDFKLNQNFPNPFNPSTKIMFDIAKPGNYELAVYNMLGKKIAELAKGEFTEGNYEVLFEGNELSSGIYFYSLSGNGISFTKKMVFLK